GGGVLVGGSLFLGSYGTGTLTIAGGGNLSCSGTAYIGFGARDSGTVNVGGGTSSLTISGPLYNGNDVLSVGPLNITAGGSVSAAALKGGNATSNVNLDGGILRITGTTSSSSNIINLLAGGGTLDVSNSNTALTLAGSISGPGGLNKTGPGKLILTGANSYAG